MGSVRGNCWSENMEISTQELKKKTISGVGVLMLRNLLMQPISFLGFVFLSVFLQRWELGVFWAVSEIVGFLGYFSDVGLAAAVIQKKKEPTSEELKATFTIQQALVLTCVLLAFALTSLLEKRFDFQNGRFLYWVLLFGFFTSSLKTIPSVLLERRLEFGKIAIVDLIEQTVFTGLAVLLAWRGFGINSWAWAVFCRSLLGVLLIYIFSPWRMGVSFKFSRIKPLFKFGVPFQVNSLLALFKDKLMNIFLWGVLGSEGVGILGWAQRWAQIPLRFLMDQVIRVTFPAYSRIQHNRERFKRALERSVLTTNLLIFPVLAGMGFLMPKVVRLFPQYHKWSVGILPFWFFLGSFAWGAVTTPLTNAFNSVGKVGITLKLMIFWTGLTWITVPLLAIKFGVLGAAMGMFLVSSTSWIAWIWAKKEFNISLIRVLFSPLIGTLIMLTVLITIDSFLKNSLSTLIILILVGTISYVLYVFLFAKEETEWIINSFGSWMLDLPIFKYRLKK